MSVYFYDDVLISKASNGLFSFSFFSSLSCFKVSKDFSGSVLSVAWVWIGLASLFWAFGQFLCLFNLFTDYIIPSQICFSFTVFFPVFFILGSFYYRSWLLHRVFNNSQLQILSGVIVAVMILDYIAFYEPYSDVILNTDFYAFRVFENILYLVAFIFSFACYFFYIRYEGGGDFFILILSLFLQFIAFVFYAMSRFDPAQDWQNIWNLFSVVSFFLIIHASTSDSIKKHHVVSSNFSEPYLYRLPENTVPFLLFGSLLVTSFFLKNL